MVEFIYYIIQEYIIFTKLEKCDIFAETLCLGKLYPMAIPSSSNLIGLFGALCNTFFRIFCGILLVSFIFYFAFSLGTVLGSILVVLVSVLVVVAFPTLVVRGIAKVVRNIKQWRMKRNKE